MRSVDESQQKLIGCLLAGGVAAFVVSIPLFFFRLFPLVSALAPLLGAAGLLSIIAGLYYGHKFAKGPGGTRQMEGRVVARFAINHLGEMIFDNFDLDAPGGKLYVKVQYIGGGREEFQATRPVFDVCGEGMRGILTTEGSWLGSFVPLADTDETKAAYRGW